ncbi:3-ketoacyl-(acyl-carrier-protein) reductase [Cordyceps fumosorosea ARSEF 2679]|uniref:3-ketoacyl-(Acyl-carrier-protein) reductase n=1 Tax=Cordyceps fumosorosea (strain ARSEF 2679) TaxID=1081104 RepID=A0A167VWG7_CORFA|nr:3-ketoacyl-(acyl-carrier-protein) reductase [Cordyceps fumosorosea ARSEF 2679]OAA63055.1 3-ketoacyl-(acyl-carrier-protein) reductase [Cordyceps fumosorosea ARSEF 2679]
MALRFAGKHAVVVGATGVIGSRVASALSRHGAAVTLLGRSALTQRARLEPLLEPLPSSSESAHRFIKLDVQDAASIKDVFAGRGTGGEAVGQVDVLVNCAGISQTTFLKRTPDEELRRVVDTNLLATMLVCKHARMQPHGCIINVSSLMATHGGFGATAYAASKAGLIDLKPELQQAYLKDTPLSRVADPDEVADAAVFLAANQFANNCILNLDGGLSAA